MGRLLLGGGGGDWGGGARLLWGTFTMGDAYYGDAYYADASLSALTFGARLLSGDAYYRKFTVVTSKANTYIWLSAQSFHEIRFNKNKYRNSFFSNWLGITSPKTT